MVLLRVFFWEGLTTFSTFSTFLWSLFEVFGLCLDDFGLPFWKLLEVLLEFLDLFGLFEVFELFWRILGCLFGGSLEISFWSFGTCLDFFLDCLRLVRLRLVRLVRLVRLMGLDGHRTITMYVVRMRTQVAKMAIHS